MSANLFHPPAFTPIVPVPALRNTNPIHTCQPVRSPPPAPSSPQRPSPSVSNASAVMSPPQHDLSRSHVAAYDLSKHDFNPYLRAVEAELLSGLRAFTPTSDRIAAQRVINSAKRLFISYFPPNLVDDLFSFAYDNSAPCAILLQGVPVDNPVPVSPPHATDSPPLIPVATAIMLGLARTIGMPIPVGDYYERSSYNGIVYNQMPGVSVDGKLAFTNLYMHKDNSSEILRTPWETEVFALLGMRGDERHEARTKVISTQSLRGLLDPEDIELLSGCEIRSQVLDKASGKVLGETPPFVPVTDDKIIMFSFALGSIPDESKVCTWASDTLGAVEAYERMGQMAWEHADTVDLQKGDLLLVNNLRALHGRTAYVAKGRDHPQQRWLVKVQMSFEGWRAPGTLEKRRYGIADWPNFS